MAKIVCQNTFRFQFTYFKGSQTKGFLHYLQMAIYNPFSYYMYQFMYWYLYYKNTDWIIYYRVQLIDETVIVACSVEKFLTVPIT